MPHKTDHLQLHGSQYRVRIAVPEGLRPQFGGKAFLIAPLGTGDLSEADRRKGEHVSAFKRMIAQARDTGDPVLRDARALRRFEEDRLKKEDRSDPDEAAAADYELRYLAEEAAAAHGPETTEVIYGIASGKITPLTDYLEEWITDRGYIGSSASHHRNAFAVLGAWCKTNRVKPTLEAITGRTAWSFRDKCLRVRSSEPKTVNNFIWSYRSHWRWLQRRGRVETNPWLGLNDDGRSQRAREQGARKRPFTDSEVRALLSGDATPLLHDLMMVAALTGARINVICELRVRDCTGGTFTFQPAKQEPGARKVPIHSDLKEIIAKRIIGKAPDEFLFDECPKATTKRPRSAAPSQAFTRYRREIQVDERAEWKRQSNVDFHSFRRWFTTKAEQAGQLPHIIDAVTGHKRPGETLGRYSQGPSMAQLRACVEAVNLPPLPAHVRKVLDRRPHTPVRRTRTVSARKRSA